MALVIVGSLLTACLLLLQGVHILRNGNMRPFFEESVDARGSEPRLSPLAKFAAASLYTVPSLAILCILTLALFRNDRRRLPEWLAGHAIGMVGGLFLLIYGIVALLRPDVVLGWIASAYPGYEFGQRDPLRQYFVRGLGLSISAFGLFIFKSL
jgi:hypothetical protein